MIKNKQALLYNIKRLLSISLLILSNITFAQKNNWQEFSREKKTVVNIDTSGIYEVNNYKLIVIWDEKFSYSKNIGYYGGIKKITIYNNYEKIQTLEHLEDKIALGTIRLSFYDYNFDGILDFTVPINSKWLMYYIFNPKTNQFEHREDWDYLRIQKIDRKNKMILSQPDGNAFQDNRKKFKVEGVNITKVN